MKNYPRKNDKISLCHKQLCLNAHGRNAQIITQGITVLLLIAGVSLLLKQNQVKNEMRPLRTSII